MASLTTFLEVASIWEFPKITGYLRVPLKGYYKGTIRIPLKESVRDV